MKVEAECVEGDYFFLRNISNFLFDRFYSLKVEGNLKSDGARILIPPHQNSLDPLALMKGVNDYMAFCYLVSFKSKFLASLGLHIGGIRVKKTSHFFRHQFFAHLGRNSIIVAFPQGDVSFPQRQVSSYKTGIARLVQIYR